MLADDILSIDSVIETGGVQTVFSQYWKVIAFAGPDSDSKIITDLMAAFWATIDGVISTSTVLSCAKMINVTNPSKEIVFPNLAGAVADEPHPPHQAIRVEIYGQDNPALQKVRNANNFSGIAQQFSDKGRLTEDTEFLNVLTFFSSDTVTDANGATLRPMVRQTTDAGTPSDPGPFVPPTYAYHNATSARLNETFRTLRSRKFELCV